MNKYKISVAQPLSFFQSSTWKRLVIPALERKTRGGISEGPSLPHIPPQDCGGITPPSNMIQNGMESPCSVQAYRCQGSSVLITWGWTLKDRKSWRGRPVCIVHVGMVCRGERQFLSPYPPTLLDRGSVRRPTVTPVQKHRAS